MLLFIKCLPRMIKMANRDLWRHVSLTISSAFSIGVALLISMLMVMVAVNVNGFTTNIEDEFIVQISLNPTATQEQIQSLQNELEANKNVASVTYSTKDEELDKLIEENGDIFSQYKGEDKNPLYDVLVVELLDNQKIESFTKSMLKKDIVIDATYGGDVIMSMVTLFQSLRIWGAGFVGVMIVLAIFLIRNTIKMAIRVRKDEIAIMRQVGAYSWYVTFPFMIEGMVTGIFGSIGPILVCIFGYRALYESMNGIFMSSMFVLCSPWPLVLLVSLGLVATGAIVGMFGSLLAVRKYLRWSR